MLPKLITILGPTGSGKSDLAIKLAQKFSGEIVSADSRQIYRDFIIGSGLVRGEWKNDIYVSGNIPHHLVQFLDALKPFSSAEFKSLAIGEINKITTQTKLPILVGGTGLYIDTLINNLEIPKIKPNLALRKKLEEKSNEELVKQLELFDPDSLKNIDKNNKRRLVRALEICLLGNTTFSQNQKKGERLFNVLKIGIKSERKELYERIDRRVDEMMENGLVSEVENLLKLYPKSAPAFSGIGYKQVIEYLERKINERELPQKIKFATHAYARRQITWFKRDSEIHWVEDCLEAEKLVKEFVKLS